jgi:putative MATE family efflux protein
MTDTDTKLRETPIRSLFISYLIPSILGMLLMSINIVVDGIFVGHALGPVGLAGVNIATPVFSVFFSIALMISIGGATIYSISLGKQDIYTARLAFSNAIIFSVALIIGIAGLCYWQIERLALLFGANEKIMPYVLDYLSVILLFGVVYVLENVLSTFIRNDGNPNLAMIGLIVTSILNIVFNYVFLFIFRWGIKGAAYATILASAIGLLILLTHFLRKSCTLKLISIRLQPKLLGKILMTGFPSFVAEISVAVVTLGFNIAFMKNVGEMGVAAFAVVNYIHTINLLFFVGVGAALQKFAD